MRVQDLLRIASGGSGILPEGELHPTLVKLLANEASKAANHVLTICIRALDYCPPVDINFGDYLRAIITADTDLVPDDDLSYRVAFVDSFRKRGIIPEDIKTLSVESLLYPVVKVGDINTKLSYIANYLKEFQDKMGYVTSREEVYNLTTEYKEKIHDLLSLKFENSKEFSDLTGLLFNENDLYRFKLNVGDYGIPKFEVHSLRRARRVGPDGDALNQIIISITQKRTVRKSEWIKLFEDDMTDFADVIDSDEEDNIQFRGGSTLIIDLDSQTLKYCINKHITDTERLKSQIMYQKNYEGTSLYATYFSNTLSNNYPEPLAMLHRL